MILPPLGVARGRELVARLPGLRVLVVGDVMLDRFVVGKVTRISPEAPVPVVRFVREFSRLGGAANVANNLAALGADVTLVGVVGADETGKRLAMALGSVKISSRGLVEDEGRPTVEKVRIVTERHQQVARIDYEDETDIAAGVEAQLIERAVTLGGDARAVLVSDYLKGTITRSLVRALLSAKAVNTPLIVDPKVPHLQCYEGATLVTPNHHEAETATHRRIRSDEDARAAAIDFRGRAGCQSVLITRGEHGMWLSSPGAEGAIPSQAREVSDVTGAGDTVVATLALALGAGATMVEAASLANHAAGIVVGKFGPATLSVEELIAVVPPS
jgi:D-beta-D-heptose 7-phosphate kinase/D-beta-D-heptose 1-phosphate adenosyltransferase